MWQQVLEDRAQLLKEQLALQKFQEKRLKDNRGYRGLWIVANRNSGN